MALDHIPHEEKNIGFKVCRNIRNTFVKIGKYRAAIQNYESTMSSSPDQKITSMDFYVMLYLDMRKEVSGVLPKGCRFP